MQSQRAPQPQPTISANRHSESLPTEMRWLGGFRRRFEASRRGALTAALRGLFPMIIAAILIVAGETWLVPRNWKYYLLYAISAGVFLNGLRVVIQAWRRREQNVAIFEHGFTLWRDGVLSAFRWDQVEEIVVSQAFLGFDVICRTGDNRRTKIGFDTAADPTRDLRDLWRELEDQSSRRRIPALLKALEAGEEAVFVRKVWGKEVGTKITVSQMGISALPRYGKTRFLEWSQVAAVKSDGERLIVRDRENEGPWLEESVMEIPGCVALVTTADHARKAYQDLSDRFGRDLLSSLLETLDMGREVALGDFSVSLQGLRYKSAFTNWNGVTGAHMERDHLALRAYPDDRRLECVGMSLYDRLTLRAAVQFALDRAEACEED